MTDYMREHRVTYIDTTPTTTATYAFMSAGFTEIGEELNPDVNKKQYVNDSQESATLRKYGPEYPFEFDRNSTDTAQLFIIGIADARSTGTAAETTIVDFLSTAVDASGNVDCNEQPVIIAVDSTGKGAPGEELVCSGKMIGNGDPVAGSFNTTTLVFTPDVS